MKAYVDKAALVAEIEKRLHKERFLKKNVHDAYTFALESVLKFLDTLEVKEVDLEEEFDNYTKDILACDVQFEPFTHLHNCAKHFYELGKAQKGE